MEFLHGIFVLTKTQTSEVLSWVGTININATCMCVMVFNLLAKTCDKCL